jgi:hypothetical protein
MCSTLVRFTNIALLYSREGAGAGAAGARKASKFLSGAGAATALYHG